MIDKAKTANLRLPGQILDVSKIVKESFNSAVYEGKTSIPANNIYKDLPVEARQAIEQAIAARTYAGAAIYSAIQSGQHLLNFKAECKHGEFEPFIKEHMPIGYRQCQKYMQLASTYPDGLIPNTKSTSMLPLDAEVSLADLFTDDAIDNEKIDEIREEVKTKKLNQKSTVKLAKAVKKNPTKPVKEVVASIATPADIKAADRYFNDADADKDNLEPEELPDGDYEMSGITPSLFNNDEPPIESSLHNKLNLVKKAINQHLATYPVHQERLIAELTMIDEENKL